MSATTKRNSSRAGVLADVVLAWCALPLAAVLAAALVALPAGVHRDQVVLFYALPAAALLVLGMALVRAREATRINLAVLGVAVSVSLLGAETYLALGPPSAMGRLRRDVASSGANARFIDDAVRTLRRSDPAAYPRVTAEMLIGRRWPSKGGALRLVSPGVSSTQTVLCTESGRPVSYRSDPLGFNNPASVWRDSAVDVVAIGDSYTHGLCQDTTVQWTGLLRARWPRLRNLGLTGAGPLSELAVLREYGHRDHPRVVLWIFYEGNDPYDLAVESGDSTLLRYLDTSYTQHLATRQGEVDVALRPWLDSLIDASRNLLAREAAFARRRADALRGIPQLKALRRLLGIRTGFPGRGHRIERMPRILATARDEVASWGGQLSVAYMPSFARYWTLVGDPEPEREPLLRALDSLLIPVIDLHRTFSTLPHPTALWVDADSHLSPAGNAVVARAIAEALGDLLAHPNVAPHCVTGPRACGADPRH